MLELRHCLKQLGVAQPRQAKKLSKKKRVKKTSGSKTTKLTKTRKQSRDVGPGRISKTRKSLATVPLSAALSRVPSRARVKPRKSRKLSPITPHVLVCKTAYQSRRGSFVDCDDTIADILTVFNNITNRVPP